MGQAWQCVVMRPDRRAMFLQHHQRRRQHPLARPIPARHTLVSALSRIFLLAVPTDLMVVRPELQGEILHFREAELWFNTEFMVY